MAEYQSYTDAQKAEALAALDTGISCREVAGKLGIPATTVRNWEKGRHVNSDVEAERAEIRQGLGEHIEETLHKLLDVIPGKFAAEKLPGLMSIAERLLSCLLRLREADREAEAPTAVASMSAEERIKRVAEMLGTAGARAAEGASQRDGDSGTATEADSRGSGGTGAASAGAGGTG